MSTGSQLGMQPGATYRGTQTGAVLLGAAVAVALGLLGFVVPLAASACRSVMKGLELPLGLPTKIVIGIGWWWMGAAVLIAGGLIAKERFVGRRGKAAINSTILVLLTLVAGMSLLAVIMPLIRVGDSLAPTR